MTDADAHDRLTGGAEPATPFWHGYERTDDIRQDLVAAINYALTINPAMRFGQLLYLFMEDLEFDIWNVYDESFIRFFESQDKL